jgi:hypothetical protein
MSELDPPQGPLHEYGHFAIFLIAYHRLPTARARRLFVTSWASTIAGFFFMRWDSLDEELMANRVDAPTGWLPGAHVTVLSIAFWAFGVWALLASIGDARRFIQWSRRHPPHHPTRRTGVTDFGPNPTFPTINTSGLAHDFLDPPPSTTHPASTLRHLRR